jgi:hypothetical protein
VDVEHPPALIDAVDRAFLDAGAVLQVHTWLRNDVRHECRSSIFFLMCVVATASNAILIA